MPDQPASTVQRWDRFEAAFQGPSEGNPFTDVTFGAQFTFQNGIVDAAGFYDGDGVYRVRFMPEQVGQWRYTTYSNHKALDGLQGEFTCVPPDAANHGPVRVRHHYKFEHDNTPSGSFRINHRHYFAYEDDTPYVPVGTTCYAWAHQGDEMEEQTLKTLSTAPFNKMRMCVFPKHYDFNHNEPMYYPFAGAAPRDWDFTRFNPAFFKHFEQRVGDLLALGIEADVILFHPYDRWGFATMDRETEERYLRYLVARLASYRNVWWSFANEYDLMPGKSLHDWDRLFQLVQSVDPAQHLRSIHNCFGFYDHAKPWVTHCSVQHSDLSRVGEWRAQYHKPVVVDECCYEGNIPHGWGNITAKELVHRFWEGFTRGGYVGHGETYVHPDDILWWSKGGVLHGDSPQRIAFLRRIVEQGPREGMEPVVLQFDLACAGKPGEYYLAYLGNRQPAYMNLRLPDDIQFTIDVIDTWAMTVSRLDGTYQGNCRVQLPGQPFLALRITRA